MNFFLEGNNKHFIGIDCFDLHKGLRALFFLEKKLFLEKKRGVGVGIA